MATSAQDQAKETVERLAEVATEDGWRTTKYQVAVDVERGEDKLTVTYLRNSSGQTSLRLAPDPEPEDD